MKKLVTRFCSARGSLRLTLTACLLSLCACAVQVKAQTITTLVCTPTSIGGGSGDPAQCRVTLDAPAPAAGVVVTLASTLPELAASVPEVAVTSGQTTAEFTIATNARYRRYSGLAFSATITATTGAASRSATIFVSQQLLPADVVVNPDGDIAGPSCAGEPGILFDCQRANGNTPGTCTFRQECTLGCETRPIAGTSWQDRCATAGVFPLRLTPRTLVGGHSGVATVLLAAGAPAGTTASVVSSSLYAQSAFGQSTAFTTGATSKDFTLRTAPVDAIQFAHQDVHVVRPDSSGFLRTLSARSWVAVVPGVAPAPNLVSLNLDASTLRGGLFTAGRACADQLEPAPQIPSAPMQITSSNPGVAAVGTVTHTPGSDCALFGVQTVAVAANTAVNINAALGTQSLSTPLLVTSGSPASAVTSFLLEPLQVTSPGTAIGTVVLNGLAPAGGALVTLRSFNTAAVTLPPSVTVAAGSDRANFVVSTAAVAAITTVTLSATYGSSPTFTSLTVLPAVGAVFPSALTVSPASVSGGATTNATLTLSAAAPAGGLVVALSSNNAAATVPASVTVAAGASSATFTVATTAVTASTAVTLSAVVNGVTRTAALTVTPAVSGPLPAPSLVSPATNARVSSTVTFDWSDVAGAASYVIEVDSSSTIAAPLVFTQTVTASQATASALPRQRLWWRVRAIDAAGNPGAWSAVRRFEVR